MESTGIRWDYAFGFSHRQTFLTFSFKVTREDLKAIAMGSILANQGQKTEVNSIFRISRHLPNQGSGMSPSSVSGFTDCHKSGNAKRGGAEVPLSTGDGLKFAKTLGIGGSLARPDDRHWPSS